MTDSSDQSDDLPTEHVARGSDESETEIFERSRRRAPLTEKLGHYTLLESLGEGGQGVVYRARDERIGRDVALKVLSHHASLSATARLRFRREAQAASKLDHPGICAVHELGEHDGTPFMAMPLLDGRTLDRWITSSRGRHPSGGGTHVSFRIDEFEEETATPSARSHDGANRRTQIRAVLRFIESAARALHAAHEVGLIHRDVKPGNIMVGSEHRAILLDFGLAREVEVNDDALTQTGDIVGTPAYMSPEQLSGRPHEIDRRTDVFSLGVTLYECLTLRRPFRAPTREGLYRAIRMADVPDPRRLNSAISRDLGVVVLTALERDRDRRYATALDMAEELRRVCEFEPIRARPAGPLLKVMRWSQRNRAAATALVGFILASLSIIAVVLTSNRELARRNDMIRRESTLKSRALDEKDAALGAYERMSDVRRLQDAHRDAEALWPARPWKLEELRSWLVKYGSLAEGFDDHMLALDALRAEAAPYSEDERRRDAAPLLAERAELQAERDALDVEADETTSDQRLDTIEDRLDAIDTDLADLTRRLEGRLSWRFSGESAASLAWRHDVQESLVRDLSEFRGAHGLLADVRERLARAESIEGRTVTAFRAEWDAVLKRLDEDDRFETLALRPQVGLIPMGPGATGLEEFLHLESHADDEPSAVPAESGEMGVGVVLVLVPGGAFDMGAQASSEGAAQFDTAAQADESPVLSHRVAPFLVSKYELTQGQWARIRGEAGPSFYRAGDSDGQREITQRHPVESVTWNECVRVLGRVGLELPSEIQWEYAARAGRATPWSTGSEVASLAGSANIADSGSARSYPPGWEYETSLDDGFPIHAPVGSFAPNAFGLHDVHGNVYEWCRDVYTPYGGAPPSRPGSRTSRERRVYRGGSFYDRASAVRSSARYRDAPDVRRFNLGVRAVAAWR